MFIADHQGLRDGSGLPWGVESAERAGCADRPFDLLCHQLNREPSRRQRRDEDLERQIARVQAANYGVYGARKVRLAPNREASRGQMHRGALTAELGSGQCAVRQPRRRSLNPGAAPARAISLGAGLDRRHRIGCGRRTSAICRTCVVVGG